MATASPKARGSAGGTQVIPVGSAAERPAGNAGERRVTSGRAHASAWHTLFGTTRAALGVSPKIPRTISARAIRDGNDRYGNQSSNSIPAPGRAPRWHSARSGPSPTMHHRAGGPR